MTLFITKMHHIDRNLPTPVVFLMIHDNLMIACWRRVFQAVFVLSRSLLSPLPSSSLLPLPLFSRTIMEGHSRIRISYMYRCVEFCCLGQIVEASSDTDVQMNSSAKRPELNSFQLVTPMIRGIGNVLFSTFSVKLQMGRIKWLLLANLWRT